MSNGRRGIFFGPFLFVDGAEEILHLFDSFVYSDTQRIREYMII